ncbi:MAG TPA: phosphate ABC transporter permease PstA [Candidatus Baltobacteraceae bacterium]|nr:phosphate ABC transporter permease PstA [Candidatus Baltobacteraceae bacterium]
MAHAIATSEAVEQRVASNARGRRLVDKIATVGLWSAAIFVVVLLALFVAYLFALGWSAISWHFLTGLPSELTAGGGVGPQIYNSFYILFLTLLMTVPIALAAGIYVQEYAPTGRFRDAVQFSAESLATVPSIVMGLFGLLLFVQHFHMGFSAIAGAFTLTLLNLPALMRVSQEALAGVPNTYREASMGLGATKWQTILRSVLPSAIGPMITGIVLISGRIFGETAALIYTAGTSVAHGNAAFSLDPFRPAETLAVHLWYAHTEALIPDVTKIGNGSALVLLVMVLIFNISARIVGRWLSIRLTGKGT